jgi:hypothetical protein
VPRWRNDHRQHHSGYSQSWLNPATTVESIFDLYDQEEIKLMRSPDKTLLSQARELRDEQAQNIVDDIAEKGEGSEAIGCF